MRNLMCCSNLKQLQNLKRKIDGDYMIATASYDFYDECNREKEGVVYLEPSERSDYKMVWGILDAITDILQRCKTKKPHLYRVSYQLEGGFPTTLDTILQNLKIVEQTVCEYKIERLYLADDEDNWMLNEAFFLYATAKRIECRIVDENGETEQSCLFTLRRSKYNPSVKQSEFRAIVHRDKLKEYREKKNISLNDMDLKEVTIGVLHGAKNNGKHLIGTEEDVNLFRNHFDVEIISFHRSTDNGYFQEHGIGVACLEDYFDRELFEKNYKIYLNDCQRIVDQMQSSLHVHVKEIDLSEYLKRKLFNYLERECLEKLYFDTCSYTFFRKHKYKLIWAWGNTNFWQNHIIYANCRQWKTKLFRREVLEPTQFESYEPYANEIELRIYYDKVVNNYNRLKDYLGRICYLPDFRWISFDKNVKAKNVCFGKKEIDILFAPTNTLMGYNTVKNYFNICKNILDRLPSKSCRVFFKNHPHLNEKIRTEIETKYGSKKYIECIDSRKAVWPIMEQCDIVVTDVSTILFDAIKMGKPVFCIAGCQDYEWVKWHKNNLVIYRDINVMCDDLLAILSDRDGMKEKLQAIVDKQTDYIVTLTGGTKKDAYGELYRILEEEIKKVNEDEKR